MDISKQRNIKFLFNDNHVTRFANLLLYPCNKLTVQEMQSGWKVTPEGGYTVTLFANV